MSGIEPESAAIPLRVLPRRITYSSPKGNPPPALEFRWGIASGDPGGQVPNQFHYCDRVTMVAQLTDMSRIARDPSGQLVRRNRLHSDFP